MSAGVAAAAALFVGLAVAMLSMAQPWVVGAPAGLFGAKGVDVCYLHVIQLLTRLTTNQLGNFTPVFVPLRYIERSLT